uniref:Uncharacterized protein n=1 Tax=Panagrolaimus superbus TaxID=310955 RepID=A0A914ZEF5_9BILA
MCYSLTSTEPLQLATIETEVKKDVESFTATVTDLTVYRQEMYFTWKNLKSVVEETTGKIPVEAVEHIYEFLLNNYEQMNNTHFVIMVQPGVNDNFQELFWKCKEDSCVYFTDSDSNKFIFILKAPKADSYKRECPSLKNFVDAEHRKNWCQLHQDKSLSTFGAEVNACNMRSYVIMSYKALLANSASGPAFGTDTFILSRSGIFGIGEKCLGKVHVFSRFSKCDPSKEKCQ